MGLFRTFSRMNVDRSLANIHYLERYAYLGINFRFVDQERYIYSILEYFSDEERYNLLFNKPMS